MNLWKLHSSGGSLSVLPQDRCFCFIMYYAPSLYSDYNRPHFSPSGIAQLSNPQWNNTLFKGRHDPGNRTRSSKRLEDIVCVIHLAQCQAFGGHSINICHVVSHTLSNPNNPFQEELAYLLIITNMNKMWLNNLYILIYCIQFFTLKTIFQKGDHSFTHIPFLILSNHFNGDGEGHEISYSSKAI